MYDYAKARRNAFGIVGDLEYALMDYCDAPYCVAVNSCTNALFLCLQYHAGLPIGAKTIKISIPKRTYISVPMQIMHAGFTPKFRNEKWQGVYQLRPLNIYDAAKRFTRDMFSSYWRAGDELNYMCLSFHWSKILGIQQGGAILHNDVDFDEWARKARFDGRTEGVAPIDDSFTTLGWHMYMSPEIAAEGLVRMMHMKETNPDLPSDDYPDLSKLELFK
jgi:dTDP-4-amino-4,6-dideoxygalactose transaminase